MLDASIKNFFYDISLIPTIIEVNYKAMRYQKDPLYFEKKKKKEEIKKAEKACKDDYSDDYPDSVQEQIETVAEGESLKQIQMIGKATKTEKIVKYAFFYMSEESANLINLTEKEKEICNAIAERFSFGKIFESSSIGNLKMYDPEYEEFTPEAKYLLSIKEIDKRKNDPALIEKISKKKEMLGNKPEPTSSFWQKGEDGKCHPIWVNPSGPVPLVDLEIKRTKNEGVPEELLRKLESKFDFVEEEHRFELNPNGLVTMYISRNGLEESFVVDPGIVMGGTDMYILGRTYNDTMFVPVSEQEIVKNVLHSAFYVLTPDEIQKVLSKYFRNMSIYRYVDLSNTEFLDKLSAEEFQKLGKKLTFIINTMAAQSNGVEIPRLRFNMWNSMDDFLLISDNAVVSPLAASGETSTGKLEGLMFEVKGDTINQRYMGTCVELHIDKYGDL